MSPAAAGIAPFHNEPSLSRTHACAGSEAHGTNAVPPSAVLPRHCPFAVRWPPASSVNVEQSPKQLVPSPSVPVAVGTRVAARPALVRARLVVADHLDRVGVIDTVERDRLGLDIVPTMPRDRPGIAERRGGPPRERRRE